MDEKNAELDVAQTAYDNAVEAYNVAADVVKEKAAAEALAIAKAATTGVDLVEADLLLGAAEAVLGVADINVWAKEKAIENLENQKERAEEQLDAAKGKVLELQNKANTSADELADAEGEVNAIQAAIDAANAVLEAAKGQLESDQIAESEAQQKYNDLTDEVYEQTILGLERELATTDSDTEKEALKNMIVQTVLEAKIAKEGEKVSVYSDEATGFKGFEVGSGEEKKIYKYSENEDGSISVYQVEKKVTKEGDVLSFESEDARAEAIGEGKVEGVDYELDSYQVPAVEGRYNVTYGYTYDEISKKSADKLVEQYGPGATIVVKKTGKFLGIPYSYTYHYEWKNNQWKCMGWTNSDFGRFVTEVLTADDMENAYLRVNNQDIPIKSAVVTNISEDELGDYSNKVNCNIETVVEPQDARTVYTLQLLSTNYEAAENAVGTQESILKAEQAKKDAETVVKNQQTYIDDIKHNGYTDAEGNEHKSIDALGQEKIIADANLKMAKDNKAVADQNVQFAQNRVDALQAAYDARYVGDTIIEYPYFDFNDWEWKTGKITTASEYDKEMAEAKAKLAEAKLGQLAAKAAVETAKDNQEKVAAKHQEALDELKTATEELAEAAIVAGGKALVVAGKAIDLTRAKEHKAVAVAADTYAANLVAQAKLANEEAIAAQEAVEALYASLGGRYSAELAKALEVLKNAKAAAEEAQKKADEALAAKEKAEAAYADVLGKLAELIEAARQADAGNSTEVVVQYDASYVAEVAAPSFAAAPAATLAAPATVLGANRTEETTEATATDGAVLGERRENGGAVLGARRGAATGDTTNFGMYVAILGAAAFAGAGYTALRRKEEEEA